MSNSKEGRIRNKRTGATASVWIAMDGTTLAHHSMKRLLELGAYLYSHGWSENEFEIAEYPVKDPQ